ncbi:hypothetical protein JN086_23985 [Mycolicibacterium austroafricanum]|uniref:hypothetical protein n=1 Tax=Mycolicibacterium austroafricanum TaxID=39687 RepID=UPI001ABFAC03|nr:hypothetical protein [Mycolicibacterium austroafricanum]QRZ06029.1 hypothetical protein JN090_24455 [Mycolicibacterium austroafricanum]QZT67514.1 hypothetical protein JN086_23985 [Mycolicibacterium austroafricanum]
MIDSTIVDDYFVVMRHDVGMTTPEVWISITSPEVVFAGGNPGEHWQLVGTIDTSQEADLNKHIQVLLNLRSTAPRISGFYLSGDPDSAWIQAAKKDPASREQFWVAIDPWGKMRSHIHGASETYLVSTEKASVARSLTVDRLSG